MFEMTKWYPPMCPIYLPSSMLKKNKPHTLNSVWAKGLSKNHFWRKSLMNARSRNWVGFICSGGRYKMGFIRACCSCHMPERLRCAISGAWWNTGWSRGSSELSSPGLRGEEGHVPWGKKMMNKNRNELIPLKEVKEKAQLVYFGPLPGWSRILPVSAKRNAGRWWIRDRGWVTFLLQAHKTTLQTLGSESYHHLIKNTKLDWS